MSDIDININGHSVEPIDGATPSTVHEPLETKPARRRKLRTAPENTAPASQARTPRVRSTASRSRGTRVASTTEPAMPATGTRSRARQLTPPETGPAMVAGEAEAAAPLVEAGTPLVPLPPHILDEPGGSVLLAGEAEVATPRVTQEAPESAVEQVSGPVAGEPAAVAAEVAAAAPVAADGTDVPLEDAGRRGLSAETLATAERLQEIEVEIRSVPEKTAHMPGAADVLKLVRENLLHQGEDAARRVLDGLKRAGIDSDYLDPDFWRGIGMVLQYQIDETRGFIQRRLHGEYQTDEFGMDSELIEVIRPLFSFLYRRWWRVTTEGLEHVPGSGRALLVANHSGVLPFDGAMIGTAIMEEHPEPRVLRNLYLTWFSTLPFIAPLLTSLGQVQGLPENAVRLLEDDQLVCVFPEGLKGIGKLFKDRYRLARFGRGGFVQAALRTGAPLVPVAVVGAEEIYPMLANAESFARLIGFPYFPITPFFPWFGLLGVIPLPTKWHITFCEPIPTAQYGPQAADDPLVVFMLTEQCRSAIQHTLDQKLAERTSIF